MEFIKRYEKNTVGRDFVIGDIHGEFLKLEHQLINIGFDKAVDRLFSVGDLVDRGPQSDDAVYYLVKERWFYSVRGNHEQMLVDSMSEGATRDAYLLHYCNGGEWFYGLPSIEQQCTAAVFKDLPLAIEVDTDEGLVGLIHAEVPLDDWNLFKSLYDSNIDYFESIAQWSRKRISNRSTTPVVGVEKVFVGHTPVKNAPLQLGNVFYIDSGAVFGQDYCIVRIQ